jgi:hypothetical protein
MKPETADCLTKARECLDGAKRAIETAERFIDTITQLLPPRPAAPRSSAAQP